MSNFPTCVCSGSLKASKELETDIDFFAGQTETGTGGWLAGLEMDRLDRLHFPRAAGRHHRNLKRCGGGR